MARGQQNTSIGFIFSNYVGRSGSGEDAVATDDEFRDAIGGTNSENRLNRLCVKVASITSNDESFALWRYGIEDRLDKVFGVVLLRRSKDDGAKRSTQVAT